MDVLITMYLIQCEHCKTYFSTKAQLAEHIENFCGIKCFACNKFFLPVKLIGHLKYQINTIKNPIHIETYPEEFQCNRNIYCKEDGCAKNNVSLPSVKALIKHLLISHGIENSPIEDTFSSTKEFLCWKERIEKQLESSYTIFGGSRKYENKKITYKNYYCKRSGGTEASQGKAIRFEKKQDYFYLLVCDIVNIASHKYIYTSTDLNFTMLCFRITNFASSCKLGYFCSSVIYTTTTEDDQVKVTFYKEHYGHPTGILNWCHLLMPRNEKLIIAGKLIQNQPKEDILKFARNFSGRTFFLDKQDLVNIEKEFGISNSRLFHDDEVIGTRLLVEHYKEHVLYFKDQGVTDEENPSIDKEEFILIIMKKGQEIVLKEHQNNEHLEICMDSTHGIGNKGFQATTLMCISNHKRGFPLSVCFSSKVNTLIISLFLNKIKDRVGVINPLVFMSDDDDIFRKSWKAVMGWNSIRHTLLCIWHTETACLKKINQIKNAEGINTDEIYHMFLGLLEMKDQDRFWGLVTSFLAYLTDKKCDDLYDYFLKWYFNEDRAEMWAMCYRPRIHLHTNNFLESMHKILKHIYFKGKKVQRVDKVIQLYIDLLDDKLHQHLRNDVYGVSDPEMSKKHSEGTKLNVQKMAPENDLDFLVQSQSKDHYYSVKKLGECNDCKYRCSACKVCRHMFECNCEDFTRHLCKHIHAVMFYLLQNSLTELPKSKVSIEEIHKLVQEISPEEMSVDNMISSQRGHIFNLLEKIREKANEDYTYETFNSVINQLNRVISLFDAASLEMTHISESVSVGMTHNSDSASLEMTQNYESIINSERPNQTTNLRRHPKSQGFHRTTKLHKSETINKSESTSKKVEPQRRSSKPRVYKRTTKKPGPKRKAHKAKSREGIESAIQILEQY